MKYIVYSFLFISFLGFNTALLGQTFELKFEEVSKNGSEYVLDVYIAFSSSAKLGTSNLQFTFTETALDNPTLVNHNLTTPFNMVSISQPTNNKVSLNIDLAIPNFGNPINTSSTWTNLARIKFDIIDDTSLGSFVWSYNGGSTETVVFLDDNITQIYATSTNNLQNIVNTYLPVELCCFKADLMPTQQVNLTWKTVSEINNSHFNIEHSTDGETFRKIGQVEGHGTTSEEKEYQFTDTKPKQGENYYRLQQVDFDGQFEYSNIVIVELTDTPVYPVSIYPNPVQDVLTIDFGDYTIEQSMKILDSQGKVVRVLDISSHQIKVEALSKGVYVLVIDDKVHLKWVKL